MNYPLFAQKIFFIFLFLPLFSFLQNEAFDESYREHPMILKGDEMVSKGEMESAIDVYKKAADRFYENKEWDSYAYCLNLLGYCHRYLREFDQARQYFNNSEKIIQNNLPANHPELGRLYYNLGYYYKFTNNTDSSEWAFNKSIKVRETSLPKDHNDLAQSYHAMGSFLQERKSDYINAMIYYEKALEIRERNPNKTNVYLGYSYYYLGQTLFTLNDIPRSINYFREAARIFEANPDFNPWLRISIYLSIANYLRTTKEHIKAKNILNKSLNLATTQYGNKDVLVLSITNSLANAYINLKQSDSAFHFAKLSISINSNPVFDSLHLAYSYETLGDIYDAMQNSDSAIAYYKKSLAILNGKYSNRKNEISIILLKIGNQHLRNQSPIESLGFYQSALSKNIPKFEPKNIFSNPKIGNLLNPIEIVDILSQKEKAYFQLYITSNNKKYLKANLETQKLVNEIAEVIRKGYFTEEVKLQMAEHFKYNCEFALQAINELVQLEKNDSLIFEAFSLIEKNRYAQLTTNLLKLKESKNIGMPDSLISQEQNILAMIAILKQEIKNLGETDQNTQNKIFSLEREYQKLIKYQEKNYPNYFNSKSYGYDFLSLSDIKKALNNDEQVIEYFWGDSSIYILSINKEKSEFHTIPKTDSLIKNLERYSLSLNGNIPFNVSDSDVIQEFIIPANFLYRSLLTPFLFNDTKSLIISANGPLEKVPFEAFVTQTGIYTFHDAPYLIKDFDFRYIYSCNLFFRDKNIPKTNPSMLAFSYSSENSTNSNFNRSNNDELPASAIEIKSISQIFSENNSKFYYGENATESIFKRLASSFDIIHLAVHGVGDPSEEINSRIEFKSNSDTLEDGLLHAYELYNLDFNHVKLAVLSACESGIGKQYEGEGIFSMARGFRYAGCHSTIMSLWKVNDQFTAKIMLEFYRQLATGKPIDESLRLSKLNFLKKSDSRLAHPANWAAFILLGDESPVIKSKPNLYYLLLLIIPFFVSYYFWKKKKG